MIDDRWNTNDLKNRNPNITIIHLIVNTEYDNPEDWYIVEKK